MYKKYFKGISFNKLRIPLYVATTNILDGKATYFSSGNLVKAIVASSSIPILFEPVKYKGMLLTDGSIADCFPIDPILQKCDFIVGVYVNPINEIKKMPGMKNMLDRSFHMALYKDVTQKKEKCNLFIEPADVGNFGIFDFEKAQELVDIGYKSAINHKLKLVKLKSQEPI